MRLGHIYHLCGRRTALMMSTELGWETPAHLSLACHLSPPHSSHRIFLRLPPSHKMSYSTDARAGSFASWLSSMADGRTNVASEAGSPHQDSRPTLDSLA
ncbi:hypothetical protein PMIN03_006126 [Paraphaeosphaeria minitans]